MRILVTGVTGQVGGAFVPRLYGRGTAGGRRQPRCARPCPAARRSRGRLDELTPDLIVNAAAYTAVDRAEDERELAFTVNAESPGVIARWAAARGVPLDPSLDRLRVRRQRRAPMAGGRRAEAPVGLRREQTRRRDCGARSRRRTSRRPHVVGLCGERQRTFCAPSRGLRAEQGSCRVVADQFGAPTSAAMIADALARIIGADARVLPAKMSAASGLVHLTAQGTTNWHGFAAAIVQGLQRRGVPLRVRAHYYDPDGGLSQQVHAAAELPSCARPACPSLRDYHSHVATGT